MVNVQVTNWFMFLQQIQYIIKTIKGQIFFHFLLGFISQDSIFLNSRKDNLSESMKS